MGTIGLGACCFVCVATGQRLEPPQEVLSKGHAWVEDWRKDIKQQTEILTTAFELDSAMQQMLCDEMMIRWRLQADFEEQHLRPLVGETDESKLLGKMLWVGENQPLNKERVAEWLENLLPRPQVKAGRVRLLELWYRSDQRLLVDRSDAATRSTQKVGMLNARVRAAPLSASGGPVPLELRLPATPPEVRTLRVRPLRGVGERDSADAALKPAAAHDRQAPLPAPAHREWARQLARCIREYDLDEAEQAALAARVAGLQRRAEAYLASRPELYEELNRTTSHAACQARLEELGLDTLFEALFEELRQDLDRHERGPAGIAGASGPSQERPSAAPGASE